jgi:hypothetical protein
MRCVEHQSVPLAALSAVGTESLQMYTGAPATAVRLNMRLPLRSFPERSREDGLYKMCGYAILP